MTVKRKQLLLVKLKGMQNRGKLATDCYGWNGAVCNNGFPRVWFEGRVHVATRAAWMAHYGKIPNKHYVFTSCENRLCTNIKHLYISKTKQKDTNNKRLFRERLNLDIPEKLAQGIRKYAQKRNITITKYMSILISRAIEIEESYEKQGTK